MKSAKKTGLGKKLQVSGDFCLEQSCFFWIVLAARCSLLSDFLFSEPYAKLPREVYNKIIFIFFSSWRQVEEDDDSEFHYLEQEIHTNFLAYAFQERFNEMKVNKVESQSWEENVLFQKKQLILIHLAIFSNENFPKMSIQMETKILLLHHMLWSLIGHVKSKNFAGRKIFIFYFIFTYLKSTMSM